MYLMFSLQIDTSENLLKLDYKLLIIYNIQQYDSNNRINFLASYNNRFPVFTPVVFTRYSKLDDTDYDKQTNNKYGFTTIFVSYHQGSSNYHIVFTSHQFFNLKFDSRIYYFFRLSCFFDIIFQR